MHLCICHNNLKTIASDSGAYKFFVHVYVIRPKLKLFASPYPTMKMLPAEKKIQD